MAGDRDVEAYLDLVRAANRPRFETLTVAAAREYYRAGRDTVNLAPVPIGPVIDASLPGRAGPIPIRRYLPVRPLTGPAPAILFFHGGGWVIGDLDTHDSICRLLTQLTGRQVIAVDYRLAPEHRFPVAVDDAMDAYRAVLERADDWLVDPASLALAGDSAGGCLALVTAIQAREAGMSLPAALLLFYPVADLCGLTPSYREVVDVPITAATMAWFRSHYLASGQAADDWRTSPLLAPDLGGLPPVFLTVAGRDPLCDEGLALAKALEAAGTSVQLRHLPDQVHGYLTLGRIIGEAERSLEAAASFFTTTVGASFD